MSDINKAREAFLDLIADAKRFEEICDGDEVNGMAAVYLSYEMTVDGRQLADLADALGVQARYMESPGDAIRRVIEEGGSPKRDSGQDQ